MLVSTQRPSTWWKMGEWVASAASLRWTLPGMTMRMGGACAIMVRICTGLVWVRMRRRSREGRDCWFGDDEGVLGVACGMVGGEVEGFEVVEVGLDLGAEVGAVAEMVEDGDNLVHGFEERVGDAGGAESAGEGDVDSLLWFIARCARGGF